jgi:hypothetical protein
MRDATINPSRNPTKAENLDEPGRCITHATALGHEADRDSRRLLHRRDIDDRHIVGDRIGDVGGLAVRRQRHPARAFAAELGAADEFQIR